MRKLKQPFSMVSVPLLLILSALVLTGCSQYKVKSYQNIYNIKPLKKTALIHYHLNEMTLKEQIAQMFMLGFEGQYYNETLAHYNDLKVGGVILFKRNIASSEQTRMLNETILKDNDGIPMLTAVDQEGGRVNRMPAEMGNIEPAYTLSSYNDPRIIASRAEFTAEQLKSLNFNTDFAPVLDIWSNPANKVISDRSFGTTPEDVIQNAFIFNETLNKNGIITSAKHFPGHGDTFADSHETLPVSYLSEDRLKAFELKPFQEAVRKNMDMMMVSHIQFNAIDQENPASLSRKMISQLLIHEMGYKGVVITDDLAMKAVSVPFNRETVLLKAVEAGNTMLLIGTDVGNIDAQIDDIDQKVKEGTIDRKIIEKNAEKILRLKVKYGIL